MSDVRTYGNLWTNRPPTIGPLSLPAASVATVGALMGLMLMMRSLQAGFLAFVVVALFTVPAVVKDGWDRSWWTLCWSKVRFKWGDMQGWTSYRSGPLSRNQSNKFELPGIAGALKLSEGQDDLGRRFAAIIDKQGDITIVLSVMPDGTTMLTRQETDLVIGQWANALADLGYQEGLLGIGVHTESISGVGRSLKEEIEDKLVPNAPPLAVASAREISEQLGRSAPQHRAWITLTFSQGKGFRGSVKAESRLNDLAARLPAITAQLAVGCNGKVEPTTPEDLCWDIYRSLNPDKTNLIEQALQENETIGWTELGPGTAEEKPKFYQHGSTLSMSWVWAEPPAGEFFDGVIKKLTSPLSTVRVLRTTGLYRPVPPAESRATLNRMLKSAKWKASQNKVADAADDLVVQSSNKVAREVAEGAALYRCGLLVTVSDTDDDLPTEHRLDRLTQAVEGTLGSSRLRLRDSRNQQAVHFYTGLPIGRVLKRHLSASTKWEDYV